MIDTEEIGKCRCGTDGKRARGARDIAPLAARTKVFVKSFYCDECLSAAAQRSLVAFSTVQKVSARRSNGLPLGVVRYERPQQ